MAKSPQPAPGAGPAKQTLAARLKPLLDVLVAARRWVDTHRMQAALLLVAMSAPVFSALGVWVYAVYIRPPDRVLLTLDRALAELDRGDYAQAARYAQMLNQPGVLVETDRYGPPMILGAVASHRADELWGAEKIRLHALAVRYLAEANRLGLAAARKRQGLLLLATNLYSSGQVHASIPMFQAALAADPAQATEIYRRLASAYCDDLPPQLALALEYSTKYLADTNLTAQQRQAGYLERARIQFYLNDLAACQQTLEQVPAQSKYRAEVPLMRGRLLLREAQNIERAMAGADDPVARAKADQLLRQAINELKTCQIQDTLANNATPKAVYQLGLCYLALHDQPAALEQFERVRAQFSDSPEAFAARLERAEIFLRLGHESDAIAAFRETLSWVGDPQTFLNPWVSIDEVRKRLLHAYQQWLEARHFEPALQLAALLSPVFPPARAAQLTAQAYDSWATQLVDAARALPTMEADAKLRDARGRYREAGAAYMLLAKLRFATRDYPEDVWKAAECLLAGQNYTGAISAFREYLKIELRARRLQALVGLGEALLAQGKSTEALLVLRECINLDPVDEAGFKARILAAAALGQEQKAPEAEGLLLEILEGDLLTPASKEWREALFSLGRLYYETHRYDQAAVRLEEAVARYPTAREALDARYLLAEAYLRGASQTYDQSLADTIAEARSRHARQSEQGLQAALPHYEHVLHALNERQDAAPLAPWEKAMLRNCYFGRSTVLFQLARFEEAIQVYVAIANRYQDTPEVLEAYVQMATCYRRLNRPQDARGTLLQAKVVFNHIKPEAAFDETTNYTRDEWAKLLDSLATL
jgi:tetratricopeptide (TPR) repeat protein